MADILDNYIKLLLIIVGPATQALRALMKYYLRKRRLTFEEFIDTNQHEIYHLHSRRRCCQCPEQSRDWLGDTSKTPIQMPQMELMFDTSSKITSKRKDNHDHTKKDMCCCYSKRQICVDDVDITLLRILLNNVCDLFFWTYYLDIEHSGNFEQFLKNRRHELFHLWQPKITCCKCNEHKNTYKRPKNSEINEREFERLYTLDRTIKTIECTLNDTCTYSARQGISQIDIRDTKLFQTITNRFCSPRKEINSIVETRNTCSHSTSIIEEEFKKRWNTLRESINKIESITESKLWTEEIIDRLENKLVKENLLNEIKTDLEKLIGNVKDSHKIVQTEMVRMYRALNKVVKKPTKNNPAQSFTSLSHKTYTEQSICLHPKQLKLKLLKLYKENDCGTEEAEKRLKENCRNLNLTFRNETPRNGNCFFDAVSSQLRDLGLRESSAEEMRENVIDYLMENREFQGVDGVVNIEHFIDDSTFEDWASNMRQNGVFADHVVVIGMARMLETNMLIVTSNPQANSENCMTHIVGKMDNDRMPIILGHVWENHYHSLISLDATRQNDGLVENNTYLCKMNRPSILGICETALNKMEFCPSPSDYEVSRADIFVTLKDRTVKRNMRIEGQEDEFVSDVREMEIPCSSSKSPMSNDNGDGDNDCDDNDLFICGKCRRYLTSNESLVKHKTESIECTQRKRKSEKKTTDSSDISSEQKKNMTPCEPKKKRQMLKIRLEKKPEGMEPAWKNHVKRVQRTCKGRNLDVDDDNSVEYIEEGSLVFWARTNASTVKNRAKFAESMDRFMVNLFQKCPIDTKDETSFSLSVNVVELSEDEDDDDEDGYDVFICGRCETTFKSFSSFTSHKKNFNISCMKKRKEPQDKDNFSNWRKKQRTSVKEELNENIVPCAGGVKNQFEKKREEMEPALKHNVKQIQRTCIRNLDADKKVTFDYIEERRPVSCKKTTASTVKKRTNIAEDMDEIRVNLTTKCTIDTKDETSFSLSVNVVELSEDGVDDDEDEDDVFICGRCETTFKSFSSFTSHKKNFNLSCRTKHEDKQDKDDFSSKRQKQRISVKEELRETLSKSQRHRHRQKLSENHIQCACHETHSIEIELWKQQEAMFVETPVAKVISQILESEQSVLIVGETGIGKSMLVHHVALTLHKEIEYSIIPCYGIRDILSHYKTDVMQLYVLDDIFGHFTASFGDIEYLLKNEVIFKRILNDGNTKVAATCRLDIFNDDNIRASCSVFTPNIFNLSSEYSRADRLKICTMYFTEAEIQLLKGQDEVFTPLMCYLYSKYENFSLTDFFNSPFELYQHEWNKLKIINPYKYCALLLCLIYNGSISESIFDIYNENIKNNKYVLKDIFDICRITYCSMGRMKRILDSLIGTYFRKTNFEYRVIHERMFDFMCGYFGNKENLIRWILRFACIEFFNERIQLESVNEQHGKFTMMISRKYEGDYFQRIRNDIQHGRLNQCLCNAQMTSYRYRALFLKVLKSIDANHLINLNITKYNTVTLYLRGYYDIVQYFISMDADFMNCGSSNTSPMASCREGHEKIDECEVNQTHGMKHTPLTAACWKGFEKIVQLLIDKGCDINQTNGMRQTPLTAACRKENEELVNSLISNGCDVNQVDGEGGTPLSVACRKGNEKIVQLLIHKGSELNQVDGEDGTLLTAACNGGNEKIVQLLIDKGCEVNQVDGEGGTPLTAACWKGKEKIVQLLIDQGCDVNQTDGMRQTPLIAACRTGNEKIVKLLLDYGCDINQVDCMLETPLTASCKGGNEKIVKLLLEKRCNVKHVGGLTKTHLTAACWAGNEKIVQLLIDAGCDVNQVDGLTETPLAAAYGGGNENIVQLLINKGCVINQVFGITETHQTAAFGGGNDRKVQLLIEEGCDVNQIDGIKQTPLTAACRGGNYKIVQLLIDKGCKVNEAGGMTQTPLTAACWKGNEKIVHLLIDEGCEINQVDGEGGTPLTAACLKGNEKTVQLLIEKGCNVNQTDGTRQTPLIVTCRTGNEKIVKLLIDNGCDINQVECMLETPLTASCKGGNEKIVKLLIDIGCDVNQVDGEGFTPLTAACFTGHETIVHLLIDNGCDVNQVSGKLETVVTAACWKGNEKLVQLLIEKGIKFNQVDDDEGTPLTAACRKENEEMLQLTEDKGRECIQVDSEEEITLTSACRRGNEMIVKLLIDKGYDINQVDSKGDTPLTAACEEGNETIVQLLIDNGCDVRKAN